MSRGDARLAYRVAMGAALRNEGTELGGDLLARARALRSVVRYGRGGDGLTPVPVDVVPVKAGDLPECVTAFGREVLHTGVWGAMGCVFVGPVMVGGTEQRVWVRRHGKSVRYVAEAARPVGEAPEV